MKSREYRNKQNDMIYWLEDGSVWARIPGSFHAVKSGYSAATFFVMVGNDTLELVE